MKSNLRNVILFIQQGNFGFFWVGKSILLDRKAYPFWIRPFLKGEKAYPFWIRPFLRGEKAYPFWIRLKRVPPKDVVVRVDIGSVRD